MFPDWLWGLAWNCYQKMILRIPLRPKWCLPTETGQGFIQGLPYSQPTLSNIVRKKIHTSIYIYICVYMMYILYNIIYIYVMYILYVYKMHIRYWCRKSTTYRSWRNPWDFHRSNSDALILRLSASHREGPWSHQPLGLLCIHKWIKTEVSINRGTPRWMVYRCL